MLKRFGTICATGLLITAPVLLSAESVAAAKTGSAVSAQSALPPALSKLLRSATVWARSAHVWKLRVQADRNRVASSEKELEAAVGAADVADVEVQKTITARRVAAKKAVLAARAQLVKDLRIYRLTAATSTRVSSRANVAKWEWNRFGAYPMPIPSSEAVRFGLSKAEVYYVGKAHVWASEAMPTYVRQRESGGDYGINTGNGYYGAYQFDYGSWLANGGGRFSATANNAPAWAQDYVAWKYWLVAGWGPWGM